MCSNVISSRTSSTQQIWRLPNGMANMWTHWTFTYTHTTPVLIAAKIREKEAHIESYRRKCAAVWLIIYNLQGALAARDELVTGHPYQTNFGRVYLFDGMMSPVALTTAPEFAEPRGLPLCDPRVLFDNVFRPTVVLHRPKICSHSSSVSSGPVSGATGFGVRSILRGIL